MDTQVLVAGVTVAGTLLVSLAGSYMGSRLASRNRWTDRVSEALPRFYAAATVAWYSWQRYALTVESAAGHETGGTRREASLYYSEHISTYKDMLSTAATLALLLPADRRQRVWDLLDLWEATSDPHSSEHENRWRTRIHELALMVLDLIGRTAPLFPGASSGS
jgi:hypothetical protein